jgi:integrase
MKDMGKLTVKELQALGLNDDGKRIREDGGLIGSVRIGAVGASVYFDWRYRFDGKVKQIAVGAWPKASLASIRAERDRLKVEVEGGTDPAERRKAERLKTKADQIEAIAEQETRLTDLATQQARLSVQGLFERWASVDLIRRKDGGAEVRRMFEKDVLPLIGAIAVEEVRKGHVTGVVDALLARGVARMAKLIFSLVRQMFRFAVDRDIIEADPTASIRKAKIGGKDVERDRVLSEDEIRQLARQTPYAGLTQTTEAAIWIALSTCCRIGELLNARREHVDLERSMWWIPPENSKNGKAHTIHLSSFAAHQFARVKELNSASHWLYPDRAGTGPVCDKTVTKQIGDRQRPGLLPMKGRANVALAETLVLTGGRWTPHDLRRTGATIMVSLGVLPEVAERCLNHTEENKVKRIYQRHSYEVEMREAWRLLGERLKPLTSG